MAMNVTSGSLLGTAATLTVPFTDWYEAGGTRVPNVIIIHSHLVSTAFSGTIWIDSMVAGESMLSFQVAPITDGITAQSATGFTVGANTNVNNDGGTIPQQHYLAFWTDGTTSLTGTYTGTGSSQAITLGFLADFILIVPDDSATLFHWMTWFSTKGGDNTYRHNQNEVPITGGITAVGSTTFTVGTANDCNESGIVYHFFAFQAVTDRVEVVTWTGTGVNPTERRPFSFRPECIFSADDGTGQGVWKIRGTDRVDTYPSMRGTGGGNYANSLVSGWLGLDDDTTFGFNSLGGTNSNVLDRLYYAVAVRNDVDYYTPDQWGIEGIRFGWNRTAGINPEKINLEGIGAVKEVLHSGTKTQQGHAGQSAISYLGINFLNPGSGPEKFFNNQSDRTDGLQDLLTDGYEVGANVNVNHHNLEIRFAAVGDDPSPEVRAFTGFQQWPFMEGFNYVGNQGTGSPPATNQSISLSAGELNGVATAFGSRIMARFIQHGAGGIGFNLMVESYDFSSDPNAHFQNISTVDGGLNVNTKAYVGFIIWSESQDPAAPQGKSVATARYVGDGTKYREITGVGFRAEMIFIFSYNDFFDTLLPNSMIHYTDPPGTTPHPSAIANSGGYAQGITTDGFIVHDQTGGPNFLDRVYYYVAWKRHSVVPTEVVVGPGTGSFMSGTDFTSSPYHVFKQNKFLSEELRRFRLYD